MVIIQHRWKTIIGIYQFSGHYYHKNYLTNEWQKEAKDLSTTARYKRMVPSLKNERSGSVSKTYAQWGIEIMQKPTREVANMSKSIIIKSC